MMELQLPGSWLLSSTLSTVNKRTSKLGQSTWKSSQAVRLEAGGVGREQLPATARSPPGLLHCCCCCCCTLPAAAAASAAHVHNNAFPIDFLNPVLLQIFNAFHDHSSILALVHMTQASLPLSSLPLEQQSLRWSRLVGQGLGDADRGKPTFPTSPDRADQLISSVPKQDMQHEIFSTRSQESFGPLLLGFGPSGMLDPGKGEQQQLDVLSNLRSLQTTNPIQRFPNKEELHSLAVGC